MRRTRRFGFTLMEAMLSMLLVLTILGMVSTLMREFSAVSRHVAARDNTFDGVQFALGEMGHELSSAVQMVTPLPGSPSGTVTTSLVFQRIDPTLRRFPLDDEIEIDADGAILPWNTRDTTKWLRVDYRKDDASGSLVRLATGAGGESTRQVMADKFESLVIKKLNGNDYDLSMSFKEDKGRLRVFTIRSHKWVKE